ncbi:MAG: FHA domain-containing protein [Polyangiaceae bacterium]
MAELRHVLTGKAFRLRADTLVGRSPRAELQLTERPFPNFMRAFAGKGTPGCCVDLGSTNGTWVNQRRQASATLRLSAGDDFRSSVMAKRWVLAEESRPHLRRAR